MNKRLEDQVAAADASAQEKKRSDEVTICVCSPHLCIPSVLQHLPAVFNLVMLLLRVTFALSLKVPCW